MTRELAALQKAATGSPVAEIPPRIRVLHVIESLAPAGAEQVLVDLVPAMSGFGVTGEVAALWPPFDLSVPLRNQGIHVHELNLPSTWSVRGGISALRHLVLSGSYDVIHAHLPMAVFYAAMSRGRVPLVATFHGLSFEHYPATRLIQKVRRRMERWWTNHRVDAYIAVSGAVADHYQEVLHVPRASIEIIPNGLPTSQLVRDASLDLKSVRKQYGVEPDAFLMVHAGRFVAQKGHVYLLQAARELWRRGIKFKLLLFGNGVAKEQAETFVAQHQLADCVKMYPTIPHEELLRVLQAADLFVFPSISEGFGMAAGEAMCLGLPVVASDLPGIATLIEDGISGRLVKPADPQALAVAIQEMIEAPQTRQNVGREARKRMEQNFAVEAIAPRIIDVYRKLIRAK